MLVAQTQTNFYDRTFHNECKILTPMMTNSCPQCCAGFVDFENCAAVTCTECEQKFCALCLEACPDDIEEHDHVRSCPLMHKFDHDLEAEGVFVPLKKWKAGRDLIMNAKLQDYVSKMPVDGKLSDGRMLKVTLLNIFMKEDIEDEDIEESLFSEYSEYSEDEYLG
jgi:hypothetical protein